MKRLLLVALGVMLAGGVFAQTADSLAHQKIAPEHGFLERLSGRWNTTVMWWPSAKDTQAVKVVGKSETHMILDGRFLLEQDSTRLSEKSYYTYGLMGYDNLKKKYVLSWADNVATGLLNLNGAVNDSGNVLTFEGERAEPKGPKSTVKFVLRSLSGNYRQLEIWEGRAGGKSRKTMEIQYARGK
ncbi:MAG TPA: DUF1579 family protein [bacterium]